MKAYFEHNRRYTSIILVVNTNLIMRLTRNFEHISSLLPYVKQMRHNRGYLGVGLYYNTINEGRVFASRYINIANAQNITRYQV